MWREFVEDQIMNFFFSSNQNYFSYGKRNDRRPPRGFENLDENLRFYGNLNENLGRFRTKVKF